MYVKSVTRFIKRLLCNVRLRCRVRLLAPSVTSSVREAE